MSPTFLRACVTLFLANSLGFGGVLWGQATPVAAPTAQPSLGAIQQLIDRGHSADALKQLDVLAAERPEPAGVERLRGMAFYMENDLASADSAFSAALKQNEKDADAAQMRGLTLFRLGRPAEAIPLLERSHEWTAATKADPSYVLALCYMDTRRYDDARHAFAAQYGFAPDSAAAYLLAARMLLRREFLPVSQEYAEKAVAFDPNLPLAHFLLGEIALAGQHTDLAIAEFEKEAARNPLFGGVYDRLGDAYTRTGDYAKAQQVLQRAVLLEPNSTGPYILLGKVLLKRQDAAGASTYLERAEKMDPANFMTHSLLGQAYRAMGRTEDATRETHMAEQLQGTNEPKLQNVH
jgi:tetratricopeptide (TPR) repeat protein